MRFLFLSLSAFLLASSSVAIQYSDVGMLCLVNKQRQRNGLDPLVLDSRLTKAAKGHSDDMAQSGEMSHTGSDGSSPSERIQDAGVNWLSAGENVAYGYSSMQAVMQAWMNSPGHRANILNSEYTMFGSAYCADGSTNYFTQDFASDGKNHGDVPNCDGMDLGDDEDNSGDDNGMGRHGRHGHRNGNNNDDSNGSGFGNDNMGNGGGGRRHGRHNRH